MRHDVCCWEVVSLTPRDVSRVRGVAVNQAVWTSVWGPAGDISNGLLVYYSVRKEAVIGVEACTRPSRVGCVPSGVLVQCGRSEQGSKALRAARADDLVVGSRHMQRWQHERCAEESLVVGPRRRKGEATGKRRTAQIGHGRVAPIPSMKASEE